jgi:hypothetical protein
MAMATKIEIPEGLDPADLEALQLALAQCRKSRRDQIDRMLKDEGWWYAARFSAYGCQIRALKLKPWQDPPCCVRDENEPRVGEESAAKLLRQMLKAGISGWHPDPVAALEEREKARG